MPFINDQSIKETYKHKTDTKLYISNLTAKNKKLIYDYYKIDFKLLKYQKQTILYLFLHNNYFIYNYCYEKYNLIYIIII